MSYKVTYKVKQEDPENIVHYSTTSDLIKGVTSRPFPTMETGKLINIKTLALAMVECHLRFSSTIKSINKCMDEKDFVTMGDLISELLDLSKTLGVIHPLVNQQGLARPHYVYSWPIRPFDFFYETDENKLLAIIEEVYARVYSVFRIEKEPTLKVD